MLNQYLTGFPFNIGLEDAFNDMETSTIVRRQLAGASLDTNIRDGYYSAVQLYEAFLVFGEDQRANVDPEDSLGSAMIKHLLGGEGDDYQRRLYYLISEIPAQQALTDLHWLTTLLGTRLDMFKVLREAGVRISTLPGRHVEIDKIGCTPFGYD